MVGFGWQKVDVHFLIAASFPFLVGFVWNSQRRKERKAGRAGSKCVRACVCCCALRVMSSKQNEAKPDASMAEVDATVPPAETAETAETTETTTSAGEEALSSLDSTIDLLQAVSSSPSSPFLQCSFHFTSPCGCFTVAGFFFCLFLLGCGFQELASWKEKAGTLEKRCEALQAQVTQLQYDDSDNDDGLCLCLCAVLCFVCLCVLLVLILIFPCLCLCARLRGAQMKTTKTAARRRCSRPPRWHKCAQMSTLTVEPASTTFVIPCSPSNSQGE